MVTYTKLWSVRPSIAMYSATEYEYLNKHTPAGIFLGLEDRLYLVVENNDVNKAISLSECNDPIFSWKALGKKSVDVGVHLGPARIKLMRSVCVLEHESRVGTLVLEENVLELQCYNSKGKIKSIPVTVSDAGDFTSCFFDGWLIEGDRPDEPLFVAGPGEEKAAPFKPLKHCVPTALAEVELALVEMA